MPALQVGEVRWASTPNPPSTRPPRDVARPPGGQRPISLEYQIYLPAIDTIVTGMADPSVGLCVSKPSANYWVFQSLLTGTVHSECSATESDSVGHYCFSEQPAAF